MYFKSWNEHEMSYHGHLQKLSYYLSWTSSEFITCFHLQTRCEHL